MSKLKNNNWIVIILVVIIISGVFVALIYNSGSDYYISSENKTCYDSYHNLIEGLVCHDEVECSTRLKFLNDKRCKELLVNGTRLNE